MLLKDSFFKIQFRVKTLAYSELNPSSLLQINSSNSVVIHWKAFNTRAPQISATSVSLSGPFLCGAALLCLGHIPQVSDEPLAGRLLSFEPTSARGIGLTSQNSSQEVVK